MENNPDRFSVIARSRKQVARPHASRARCDPPISARRSPSSRHLAPINAQLRAVAVSAPGQVAVMRATSAVANGRDASRVTVILAYVIKNAHGHDNIRFPRC
ncbi:hypothetical protein EVAR_96973_1 [Eumeta japonica]|uniref:Uncharacterized protein n=1 Tax=Eumeta variegata TaxID=151549 RepID=A0A4C1VEJ9_EUMVA|nr:hypothetical protein EVAR_96973_1 [Eumeta japonica]